MKIRNFIKNRRGFTLNEVMIGMMILSIAIVAATNLLTSLINANKTNVSTLQAYYLAQEGIEAVRNMRDTNWMHNVNFAGDNNVYPVLSPGNSYAIFVKKEGWRSWGGESASAFHAAVPWEVVYEGEISDVEANPYNSSMKLEISDVDEGRFGITKGPAEFYRHVNVFSYFDEEKCIEEQDECDDFIRIEVVVNWMDGASERELKLDTVLSDWKGGAI